MATAKTPAKPAPKKPAAPAAKKKAGTKQAAGGGKGGADIVREAKPR